LTENKDRIGKMSLRIMIKAVSLEYVLLPFIVESVKIIVTVALIRSAAVCIELVQDPRRIVL